MTQASRFSRAGALLAALSALLLLAAAPAPARAAPKQRLEVRLSLEGVTAKRLEVCGQRRRVALVKARSKLTAVALVRNARRRRRGAGGRPRTSAAGDGAVLLRTDRCQRGKWAKARERRLGRGPGRFQSSVRTVPDGDYRLSARFLGDRRRRPARSAFAYLRIVPEPGGIVDSAVSFKVKNTNGSKLSCSSDGKDYTLRGRLVAPRATLSGTPGPVVLHLHGLGFGTFFWQLGTVEGYAYATELAKLGHASVVVDRLGYDASDHPEGTGSCFGSQADVSHQVVQALRSGSYELAAEPNTPPPAPVRFAKVALAGHSAGGAIAQIEAYSFTDIDALLVMAYADQGQSATVATEFTRTSLVCATGGEQAEPGGSVPGGEAGGYAYLGQSPEDFKAAMFHDADPAVIEAATAMRNRDPCGDTGSALQATNANQSNVGSIAVPVLLVYGRNDALFPPAAGEDQKELYTGAKDLTAEFLADTGHALTLERSAPRFRQIVSDWLAKRGF